MPQGKSNGTSLHCPKCKKEYSSKPALREHRCLPGEGIMLQVDTRFFLHITPQKTPQGIIKEGLLGSMLPPRHPKVSTSVSIHNWEHPSDAAVVNWRNEYLAWATTEFIEGRFWSAMTPSSAKQVIGSVTRLLEHGALQPSAPLLFFSL